MNHTDAQTQPMKNTALRGVLCTLAGSICWGFSGVCGQFLFQAYHIDALWLTAIRMVISGVLIMGYLISRRPATLKTIWQNKTDLWQLFFFTLIGLVACQYTYLKAIEETNAGTATVLQYLGPLLIMGYTCLKDNRLPKKQEGIAILFALIGTFLLATHGNFHTLVISTQGLFWGICAAVGIFAYTVIPVHLIVKFGSLMIIGYGMLLGGSGLSLAIGVWQIPVHLPPDGLLALASIIFLGSLAAYCLYLQGVQDIGAVKASMLASVEPVAATIISALWLDTRFIPMDFLGFFFIMSTVFLLSKK